MVTTNGAGLNPNAKVWQERPVHENDIPEGTEESAWLHTYPPPAEMTDDIPSAGGKGCDTDYFDNGHSAPVHTEHVANGIGQPDLGYLVLDPQLAPGDDISKEEPMSEESLRESLKKQLEFCFSRENLYKDLYLISQMDSDQFVPIWTIACMEHIKSLTTDVDLIREVLQASPMVQVDEAGEKVRPNHSRCIIILREVSETTPVEEVEALFNAENCPKALGVEFAHNSNWYITFQSDMDALQAYRYLREEVKMFQGKPVMARIKAINTFFGKNTFCSVESSGYNTQQGQYASPVYMQQVYSPQQSYPVYPVVSPSWNPSVSYFDTPVAPFANGPFMNGYSSLGYYKRNSTSNRHGPMSKNRNHGKGHERPADVLPHSLVMTLMDGNSGPLSPSGPPTGNSSEPVSLPAFSLKELSLQTTIPSGDLYGGGRVRRGSHRGMRRKREDELNTRPVPLMEAKVPPPPKFDLAASNFPPLPGCMVNVQGKTMPEMRLSDVVRGLKVTNKTLNQQANETEHTTVLEDAVTTTGKPAPLSQQTVASPRSCVSLSQKEEDGKAEAPIQKAVISPMQAVPPVASEHASVTCTEPVSPEAPLLSPTSPTSEQGLRKLSYAEVCQRLSKEPPPVQMSSPLSPASSASQPVQELNVNIVEEPRLNSRRTVDKPEKAAESRQPLRSFRGANGQVRVRGAGLKNREHHRGLNSGKNSFHHSVEPDRMARTRTFPQGPQNNLREKKLFKHEVKMNMSVCV